jgi:hypothetical protein
MAKLQRLQQLLQFVSVSVLVLVLLCFNIYKVNAQTVDAVYLINADTDERISSLPLSGEQTVFNIVDLGVTNYNVEFVGGGGTSSLLIGLDVSDDDCCPPPLPSPPPPPLLFCFELHLSDLFFFVVVHHDIVLFIHPYLVSSHLSSFC